MAENVLMLALSPTMEEGTISSWHKKEGDTVGEGDLLCEVETDKATMEYESVNAGILLKILVPAGGQAGVGSSIGIVGEQGEDISGLIAEAASASAASETTAAGPVPAAEKESAATESPAVVKTPAATEIAAAAPATLGASRSYDQAPQNDEGRVRASPLARRLAREQGIKLGALQGSGPGGRVIKRDLDGAKTRDDAGTTAVVQGAPAVTTAGDERIPHSKKRRIIAQRLAESKYSAPHFYLKIDVAMDKILAARKRLNSRRKIKISLNAFLMKMVAEALKRHPQVNATWQEDAIVRFGRIDVGLAVAQEDGLITPVVRSCDQKGIVQIDEELSDLVDRARNNKLAPEEFAGATFTITSLGSAGIVEFTAIINPPGSAILAVGKIDKQPVVGPDDQISIQSKMMLTLSCDHRVVDGMVGAVFLNELKGLLEEPIQALY